MEHEHVECLQDPEVTKISERNIYWKITLITMQVEGISPIFDLVTNIRTAMEKAQVGVRSVVKTCISVTF